MKLERGAVFSTRRDCPSGWERGRDLGGVDGESELVCAEDDWTALVLESFL